MSGSSSDAPATFIIPERAWGGWNAVPNEPSVATIRGFGVFLAVIEHLWTLLEGHILAIGTLDDAEDVS